MVRALLVAALIGLTGCQAQLDAEPINHTPENAAKAVADPEISRLRYKLGEANKRFSNCKNLWKTRRDGDEVRLRAERELRETIVRQRPDMIANGEYFMDEERAERRRMEMDQSYKSLDPMDCFG